MESKKKTKFNPYTELEVPKNADAAQIKTAYKKHALKWHPDKHAEEDREKATEKFKQVSEAYSILSNDKRRKYFDKHGTIEGEDDCVDMDDIFKDIFKGGSMSFSFDDFFDDFSDVLKGGKAESRSFNKMFRDMGKGYRAKPKGRARPKAGGKAKGGMGDMEEMMMAMMMGEVMGGMMGGKPGKGGKKASANPFMDMYDSEDDDLFDGDEYDSDEIEVIGKQMGLNKKEVQELKADLKVKYGSKKSKSKAKKDDDGWQTESDEEIVESKTKKSEQSQSNQQPGGQASTGKDDNDWETDSD